MADKTEIGLFLAKLRKEKKMTQAELAEQLHVSNKTVSRWETGVVMPDYTDMIALCSIYGIEIQELFAGKRMEKGISRRNRISRDNRSYLRPSNTFGAGIQTLRRQRILGLDEEKASSAFDSSLNHMSVADCLVYRYDRKEQHTICCGSKARYDHY